MKLSLICEASHEADLAKKIIELIAKAHGASDPKALRDQTFTAGFLSDDAKIEENDRVAAYKADLLVMDKDAQTGENMHKLSDKAFKLAAKTSSGGGQGLWGQIMGGAPGASEIMRGVGQLTRAMRGGK
jgi:hypothetical protein